MTKYEYLIKKSDDCYKKASQTNDGLLRKFYLNACDGYKIKAENLKLGEAGAKCRKIYISGKITGNPHYMVEFILAETEIIEGVDSVAEIINPARLELIDGATWSDYMKRDIELLVGCDIIFMMKGWRRSKGARLERHIAKKLGMEIIYEN